MGRRDAGLKRAALVTGASSGIGLAIARVLADEGYNLTIAARGEERLRAAGVELAAIGAEVEVMTANVARQEDVIALVARHRARFGRLDVLVNNAGMGVEGPIDDYPTKYIDLQMAVNIRAVIVAYREAIDLLRAAGADHQQAWVVNTSSISGKVGEPELAVYAATKHAVVGFADSMNRELFRAGIRSCALCPGFVDTPLSDYVKDRIPVVDMIQPEDVAEGVRYLLRLSPACLIPELVFMQGEALGLPWVPPESEAAGRIEVAVTGDGR